MAYKCLSIIMKRILIIFLGLCSMVSMYSQNPIAIEKIINDLDWEYCSESDVILAFKDNIEKRAICTSSAQRNRPFC